MANKKWQFTFADFKSCSLIHAQLIFEMGRAGMDRSLSQHTTPLPQRLSSLHPQVRPKACTPPLLERGQLYLLFRSGKRWRYRRLMEINNKNCCRLKEKCRVVQLIYSGPLALSTTLAHTTPLHPRAYSTPPPPHFFCPSAEHYAFGFNFLFLEIFRRD